LIKANHPIAVTDSRGKKPEVHNPNPLKLRKNLRTLSVSPVLTPIARDLTHDAIKR
jgi:hypothetical protein